MTFVLIRFGGRSSNVFWGGVPGESSSESGSPLKDPGAFPPENYEN